MNSSPLSTPMTKTSTSAPTAAAASAARISSAPRKPPTAGAIRSTSAHDQHAFQRHVFHHPRRRRPGLFFLQPRDTIGQEDLYSVPIPLVLKRPGVTIVQGVVADIKTCAPPVMDPQRGIPVYNIKSCTPDSGGRGAHGLYRDRPGSGGDERPGPMELSKWCFRPGTITPSPLLPRATSSTPSVSTSPRPRPTGDREEHPFGPPHGRGDCGAEQHLL